jgi:virginiamycin A acetyltransferase
VKHSPVEIARGADVSPDAKIYPSVRGTRIRIGADTRIAAFAVLRSVGGSGDIEIGQRCHVNEFCVLYSGSGIYLGDDVLLGPGTMIVPANHRVPARGQLIREAGFDSRGGVRVGSDVWIGAGCMILDGSRIGDGAVVSAGSIVTGEIPCFEVWRGCPARRVRARG